MHRLFFPSAISKTGIFIPRDSFRCLQYGASEVCPFPYGASIRNAK